MPRPNTRAMAKQREAEWYVGRACHECGSTDGLRIVWNGVDKQPVRAMTYVFLSSQKTLDKYLPQCVALCSEHFHQKTRRRNEHGGGLVGRVGCKCELCLEARRVRTRLLARLETAAWKQRQADLAAGGLPTIGANRPRRNAWNLSSQGREVKRAKRLEARQQWIGDRVCADCGSDQHLVAAWKQLPGPLKSTGNIWMLGKTKRQRYLPLCQVVCNACTRIRWKKWKAAGR
jgi:hypothetical protein